MRRPRLFVAVDPQAPELGRVAGDGVRHIAALRLRPGDAIDAIVGPGDERQATIESLGRDAVVCRLGAAVAGPSRDPQGELVLAIALADDPARLDFVIEKATELGVTRIAPFRAARSQRNAVGGQRLARWRRIARAACEQCGRTRVPAIDEPVELVDLLARLGALTALLVLVPGAPGIDSAGLEAARGPIGVVVGPEGGLTEEEIAWLVTHGGRALGLGPRTLRFDTAAIAALVLAAVRVAPPALAPRA
jgi:16S rRNA (uracil1498-N3)-methyltransferase